MNPKYARQTAFPQPALFSAVELPQYRCHGKNAECGTFPESCGLTELEILNSRKDTYNDHYNIIETMAKRMLEKGEPPQEKEPMYLAMVTNEIPLMARQPQALPLQES